LQHGINEDLFKTLISSWRDAWLLDTGATCHMTFQRDFFEELNDNVEGAINFSGGSNLKPMGIGTINLKLPRFLDFILHNVLYLPRLQRKLFSCSHFTTRPFYSHV